MKQKLLKIVGVVVAAALLVALLVVGYRADKVAVINRQKITLVYMSGDSYLENLSVLHEQGYSFLDEETFDKLADLEASRFKRVVYSTAPIKGGKAKCFMPNRPAEDTISVARGYYRSGRGGRPKIKVPPGYYAVVAHGD